VIVLTVWKLLAAWWSSCSGAVRCCWCTGGVRPRSWSDSSPAAYFRRLVVPLGAFLLATWLSVVVLLQINLRGDVAEVTEIALSIVR
jgi:hypothetical protein